MNATRTEIGNNLRMYRARKHVSQRDVAEQLGVFDTTVYNWERGQSTPTYEQAWALADYYGVSLDELGGRKYEP